MPTYVYRCQQCGAVLERRQGFQDPPLTVCETCSGELRRVLQPVGIIFRGSGFYTTDYRNSSFSNGRDERSDAGQGAEEDSRAPSGSSSTPSTSDEGTGASSHPSSSSTAVAGSD
ncbi:MAG: FmdB family transcriptional regulator [Chloroflexi bacterium]|nr:FmdB family transcriptional regulator [Chloroflexota bacterium]